METNLNVIKKLSKQKWDENWEFRSFFKGYDISLKKLDSIVHRLYKQVSAQIDCTQCANCCKEVRPILSRTDIRNFSTGLGIPPAEFQKKYLTKDDESQDFIFNKIPCPFLKGNLCSNYDFRPKDCRSFPHLHKKDFVFRLIGIIDNCSICPIVFRGWDNINFIVKLHKSLFLNFHNN